MHAFGNDPQICGEIQGGRKRESGENLHIYTYILSIKKDNDYIQICLYIHTEI